MGTSERDRLLALQRLLLPNQLPDIGCTEAAAAYRAHNHDLNLGGDWYDLIDLDEQDRVVAIVGDVVGHGLEQISVMGQLRAASNALTRSCEEPHEILTALDGFAHHIPGAAMATLAIVSIDGSTTAQIASAGHPPPLHVTKAGHVHFIETGRRAPLTLGGPDSSASFDFAVEDLIVLYTDGVVERRGENIDIGLADLAEFVRARRRHSCRDLASAVVDEFAVQSDDDCAVIVLRPLHQRADGYRRPRTYTPSVALS